jgi:hypothetical protein
MQSPVRVLKDFNKEVEPLAERTEIFRENKSREAHLNALLLR